MGINFQKQASVATVGQQNQCKHCKKLGQKVDFFKLSCMTEIPGYCVPALLSSCSAARSPSTRICSLKCLLPMVSTAQLALTQWERAWLTCM